MPTYRVAPTEIPDEDPRDLRDLVTGIIDGWREGDDLDIEKIASDPDVRRAAAEFTARAVKRERQRLLADHRTIAQRLADIDRAVEMRFSTLEAAQAIDPAIIDLTPDGEPAYLDGYRYGLMLAANRRARATTWHTGMTEAEFCCMTIDRYNAGYASGVKAGEIVERKKARKIIVRLVEAAKGTKQ